MQTKKNARQDNILSMKEIFVCGILVNTVATSETEEFTVKMEICREKSDPFLDYFMSHISIEEEEKRRRVPINSLFFFLLRRSLSFFAIPVFFFFSLLSCRRFFPCANRENIVDKAREMVRRPRIQ